MIQKQLRIGFPLVLLATTTLEIPCAAQTQGCIVGWGDDNFSGVIDDIPSGSDFIDVQSSFDAAVALRSDGSLVAWGRNNYGQVSMLPAGSDFVDVSFNGRTGVAVREDGTLAAWGFDNYGQVSSTPAGNGYLGVACCGRSVTARLSDGSLTSWGQDADGLISDTPTESGFVRIHSSKVGTNMIAERSDGSIVTWGYEGYALGADTPSESGLRAVALGERHACVLRADGSLFSWGHNTHGQVSDTPAGNDFADVTCYRYGMVALRMDGSLTAWGEAGQEVLEETPNDAGYFAVSGGFNTAFALRCESSTVGQAFGFCTNGPCGAIELEAGCPNSTGLGATLLGTGSASVAADDLTLSLRRLPPAVSVILFKGPIVRPTPLLFGDGLRWVGGALNRYPVGTTNSAGELAKTSIVGDSANFPSAGLITAGSTWYFQGWYRDRSGPCNGQFNLTHGLQVDFQP